jgi:hypothetical protein
MAGLVRYLGLGAHAASPSLVAHFFMLRKLFSTVVVGWQTYGVDAHIKQASPAP